MCYSEVEKIGKCKKSPLDVIFGPYSESDEQIDLCDDPTTDAIFIQDDGSIYTFRGRLGQNFT